MILPPALMLATEADISPHFRGSTEAERRALQIILRHEATPEAIREFTRQRAKLGDYTYWFTLGTLWVSYTGWSDLNLWKRLLSADRPNRAECLMKPESRVLLGLPDEFSAYRAHRPHEADWISYSLNPEIAGRFAAQRGARTVTHYRVRRADALALFLRRGEEEILILDRSRPVKVRDIPVLTKAQVEAGALL